jgi:bacterioferritin (cytochrome b1)
MLFYTHAANMLVGMERLYLADKLKEHAKSEMDHVFEFAQKIRANGGIPVSGLQASCFDEDSCAAAVIINKAIELEKEVVARYHERHKQATELYEKSGQNYDLIIFLEEQIEHSQNDIDEMKLIVNAV